MDFGDILTQWSEVQKKEKTAKTAPAAQVSHKKANAPSAEEKAAEALKKRNTLEGQMQQDAKKTVNPMELWLRRYGTVDKDRLNEESEEASRMEDRTYLKNMRPEARIDLHGLTRDEAWSKLEAFVDDCLRRGLKKIEIVHGKGIHSHGSDPVLGQMVRTFIEQNRHLGVSGHNDRNHGGSGATWVLLK
ncbi:MAG: Smr/MutS family protein [Spirochaetia bacterium]|uniref:Smr/MutS family protein n=1 Tax=Treponema berlinense TaxID=225004 RepID=UPI0015BF07D7|nr:Smr/MutS family protein [Treponema berlinense]MDD5789114.1 Smr/MutS family protein [Spirochaetia bacterium]